MSNTKTFPDKNKRLFGYHWRVLVGDGTFHVAGLLEPLSFFNIFYLDILLKFVPMCLWDSHVSVLLVGL